MENGILHNTAVSILNDDTQQDISLLLVEDNEEVQQFLASIFQPTYKVLLAANGKEGLSIARAEKPDLIISDIMMPIMDGITFCQKVKSDINISHIPVLLLTAKNAETTKLEGLRLGADDYITKPFHPEELHLRVRNLIQSREEIRTKFTRVLNVTPSEITVTSADEEFLQRAMEIVEEQMDNPNFGVEQFAHQIAVSRPLLFTKLKAITGQTPNNFVKSLRLKRAMQLLSQNKLTISEIAYHVGFRDPKYFSKCFQKEFGVSPSNYSPTTKE